MSTFMMKFSKISGKHTTEFVDFDPFSLDSCDIKDLCYMLTKTCEALLKIAEYEELYSEVKENEFET